MTYPVSVSVSVFLEAGLIFGLGREQQRQSGVAGSVHLVQ